MKSWLVTRAVHIKPVRDGQIGASEFLWSPAPLKFPDNNLSWKHLSIMSSKRNFKCFCINSFMYFFYLRDKHSHILSWPSSLENHFSKRKFCESKKAFSIGSPQANQKVVQQWRHKPTFTCGMQYVNTNSDQILREKLLEFWFWVCRASPHFCWEFTICVGHSFPPQSLQKPDFWYIACSSSILLPLHGREGIGRMIH